MNETIASRTRLAEEVVVLRGYERGGTAKVAMLNLALTLALAPTLTLTLTRTLTLTLTPNPDPEP